MCSSTPNKNIDRCRELKSLTATTAIVDQHLCKLGRCRRYLDEISVSATGARALEGLHFGVKLLGKE
jgi:hypothetical protein